MSQEYLVVGLGNPGAKYSKTVHNAGFRVCDHLIERHDFGKEMSKFQGRYWEGLVRGSSVRILMPQTFMNLSGESVAKALRYCPVDAAGLLLVFDDMDITAGKLRLRADGGHGGHNGMRSVIDCVGTKYFSRVKIGVGHPDHKNGATHHLLGKIAKENMTQFDKTIELATEAVELILTDGINQAMNHYNGLDPV